MHIFKRWLLAGSLPLILVSGCVAQDSSSTTVTLPGGFTISTTSLIVGTLAVVAAVIAGIVYAARRTNTSNTTTTTIFQNTGDISNPNARQETRQSSPRSTFEPDIREATVDKELLESLEKLAKFGEEERRRKGKIEEPKRDVSRKVDDRK
jgi:hypothetical protein